MMFKKLTFAITAHPEDLNHYKEEQEDRDPDSHVDACIPEPDGNRSCGEFEWQNCKPGQCIVPADRKSAVNRDR